MPKSASGNKVTRPESDSSGKPHQRPVQLRLGRWGWRAACIFFALLFLFNHRLSKTLFTHIWDVLQFFFPHCFRCSMFFSTTHYISNLARAFLDFSQRRARIITRSYSTRRASNTCEPYMCYSVVTTGSDMEYNSAEICMGCP